jgi:GT2 family glycosyltransferase
MNFEMVRKEMEWSFLGSEEEKDILLVVHDGYEYVKNCVDSVFKNTKSFRLHVWDNASATRTSNYLKELASLPNVKLYRSETNEGFIIPNNRMVREASSEWVVLLNSDTEVLPRWDEVMIGTLKNNPEIRQVGFSGGILSDNCEFVERGVGEQIDYVCGYCFCMSRKTIKDIGLFDEENICFAYCEDSDLSLRIRERGWRIYSCYSDELVRHYGSKTSSEVMKKDERLESCARLNLEYLKKRWKSFLLLYKGGKMCYHV